MTAPHPTMSIPLALFDDVVKLNDRRTDRLAWAIEPGSSLAEDDRWGDPYYVSHAAMHRLHSGIDNLHAIKLLLVDAETLPTYASFTLIRAGIENAASVTWLLEPTERHVRVLRRLQLAASNAKSGDSAIALMQENAGPGGQAHITPLPDVLDRVREAAATHGISESEAVKKPQGWAEIVKAASKDPRLSNTQLFLWRMCSAFTHADEWPSLALLSTPEGGDVNGIVPLKVETPTGLAVMSFGLAMRMLRRAVALYDSQRRIPS